MENQNSIITIESLINAPVSKVWTYWNEPEHITRWYFASDDWHAPEAENNLKVGGKLKINMAAKDGSFSFDFEGTHTYIVFEKKIDFTIADGRRVAVSFNQEEDQTRVIESFEMETQNSEELQRSGWQAILNNFKKYVETKD